MGAPEYEAFLDLSLRFPRVHLDTTMAFTDFMERTLGAPFLHHRLADLAAHADRVCSEATSPTSPTPMPTS
jgi:hypothetical protein